MRFFLSFKSNKYQGGFNLLEILIALALGAFVLAGVIQIYVSNQYAARYQQGMAQVQEQGRFALDLITRYIRIAGYDNTNTASNSADVFPPRALTPPATATDDASVFGIDGGGTLPDTLIIRFEGEDGVRDCLGYERLAAKPWAIEVFLSIDAVNEELDCSITHAQFDDSTTPPTVNVVVNRGPLPLAIGVENMQLLYGQDLPPNDGIPNRFVRADQVTDWQQVVSVQVAILVHSIDEILSQPEPGCLSSCTIFNPANPNNDRRLRGEFTTTVGLRNP